MSTRFIEDGTVAASVGQSQDFIDPRRRRYGFGPGLREMEMEPRDSGRQLRLIPQHRLVLFKTATLADTNYDITADTYQPQIRKDFDAAFFVGNVKTRFEPMGFRELSCLTLLEDPLPHQLFDVIHPTFAELGHACPQWGQEDCATCWLEILKSDDTKARIFASGLDFQACEELRQFLIGSYSIFLDYARFEWNSKVSEREARIAGASRGITMLGEGEHHFRKHLHATAPADQPALTAAAYGEAASKQFGAVIERLAVGQEQLAEALKSRPNDDSTTALLQMVADLQRQVLELQKGQAPSDIPAESITKKEKQK